MKMPLDGKFATMLPLLQRESIGGHARGRSGHLVVFLVVLLSSLHLTWLAWPSLSQDRLLELDRGLAQCRQFHSHSASAFRNSATGQGRVNPRWNKITGQQGTTVLRNATLFDGESFLAAEVNIVFSEGVISSVYPASAESPSLLDTLSDKVTVWDVGGKYVTPGLVDMHSHHLLMPFPSLKSTEDVNEKPLMGPLTPFIRAIDGSKAYDPATALIASGGVTSSLLLPGSGNIIGGEAYMVKNTNGNQEPVVNDLLFDYGVPEESRQRYMKMACGENPKSYGHTRMGNIWLLREHLSQAQKLLQQQDNWCEQAESASSSFFRASRVKSFFDGNGELPESLDLEPTVALLRGQVNLNVHSYEPQDIERFLVVCEEFGIMPRALHHALEAWMIPELIKKHDPNITIAIFADNSLYKHEAFGANLRAGKILAEHGLPVAFKSDHTGEKLYARYLLSQASLAYHFGMQADAALQAVTSIPARSVQQDHRVGYARQGYDADLVIWDAHPLAVGATPLEIFIDGTEQLKTRASIDAVEGVNTVQEQVSEPASKETALPKMRPSASSEHTGPLCNSLQMNNERVIFTGIVGNLLSDSQAKTAENNNLTMVVDNGQIACLDSFANCQSAALGGVTIALDNGYVTPGLVAVSQTLGMVDILAEASTRDGDVGPSLDEKDLDFAQYGVHLDGPAFDRARIGGVTKAVTMPLSRGGLLNGVSVGIRTSVNRTLLDGGIFQSQVGLHVNLGQDSKGPSTPTISGAVAQLRKILSRGLSSDDDGIHAQASGGEMPVVVNAVNQYAISQVILLKKDYPAAKLVIYGGHEAPSVANDLAAAKIPVILTGNRGAPDAWEKRAMLPGPPLSPSPARVLSDAGVLLGIAVADDFHLQSLASEAGWAAKYAGLSDTQAIELVSRNIEAILGLEHTVSSDRTPSAAHAQSEHAPTAPTAPTSDHIETRIPEDTSTSDRTGNNINWTKSTHLSDIVVWQGNPLAGEGSVVVSFEQQQQQQQQQQHDQRVQDQDQERNTRYRIGMCWPDAE